MPQESLDSFAPEFRQGMAARAAELGDVGESARSTGRSRSGRATCTSRSRCSRPTRQAWRRSPSGRGSARAAAGRRGDLASGLLPAPDRTHLVRLQGRHRPARGRRQRRLADQPAGAAAQGRRDRPRLPRRDGRAAADADARGARPQRHLRRVPQAAHPGRRLPAVPARKRGKPRGGGAAGREDGRALAERRAAGALPRDATIPSSAPIPSATTISSTATIRVGSSAPPARTPAAPTRATRSTTTAASTCASTG